MTIVYEIDKIDFCFRILLHIIAGVVVTSVMTFPRCISWDEVGVFAVQNANRPPRGISPPFPFWSSPFKNIQPEEKSYQFLGTGSARKSNEEVPSSKEVLSLSSLHFSFSSASHVPKGPTVGRGTGLSLALERTQTG